MPNSQAYANFILRVVLGLVLLGIVAPALAQATPAHTLPSLEPDACAAIGDMFYARTKVREVGWSLASQWYIVELAFETSPHLTGLNRFLLFAVVHIYLHPRYRAGTPVTNQRYAERRCRQIGFNAFRHELWTFTQAQNMALAVQRARHADLSGIWHGPLPPLTR